MTDETASTIEDLGLPFTEYIRKPFTVQVVEVRKRNIKELAPFIGTLKRSKNGAPYIEVDPTKVDRVTRVFCGYFLTLMNGKIRCYKKEVFHKEFTVLDAHAQQWVTYLEGPPEDDPTDVGHGHNDALDAVVEAPVGETVKLLNAETHEFVDVPLEDIPDDLEFESRNVNSMTFADADRGTLLDFAKANPSPAVNLGEVLAGYKRGLEEEEYAEPVDGPPVTADVLKSKYVMLLDERVAPEETRLESSGYGDGE